MNAKLKPMIALMLVFAFITGSCLVMFRNRLWGGFETFVLEGVPVKRDITREQSLLEHVKIIKEPDYTEQALDWIGGRLLFNHRQFYMDEDNNILTDAYGANPYYVYFEHDVQAPRSGLYAYDPGIGKKELVAEFGEYDWMDAVVSKDKTKVLLHDEYNYSDDFNGLWNLRSQKQAAGDFEYFDMENKKNIRDRIRIYDDKTKEFTLVEELKPSRWRTLEGVANLPVNNFIGLGLSNDGNYAAYCTEEAKNRYSLTVYDVRLESQKTFLIIEKEERFSRMLKLCISSDGKRVWFGTYKYLESTYGGVYRVDLDNIGEGAVQIAEDAGLCQTAWDDRMLVYVTKQGKLLFMDTATKESTVLSEEIILSGIDRAGFDVSADGKRIAYLEKGNDGCGLYIRDLDPGKETTGLLLYRFDRMVDLRCLKWNNDGSKIIVTYARTDDMYQGTETCILELK